MLQYMLGCDLGAELGGNLLNVFVHWDFTGIS